MRVWFVEVRVLVATIEVLLLGLGAQAGEGGKKP